MCISEDGTTSTALQTCFEEGFLCGLLESPDGPLIKWISEETNKSYEAMICPSMVTSSPKKTLKRPAQAESAQESKRQKTTVTKAQTKATAKQKKKKTRRKKRTVARPLFRSHRKT